jgi:hypothetical protein
MNTIKIRFYKTIQEEVVGDRNEQIVINTSFLSTVRFGAIAEFLIEYVLKMAKTLAVIAKNFAASASNQIKKRSWKKIDGC